MQDLCARLTQVMECRVDSIVGGEELVEEGSKERFVEKKPVLKVMFVALDGVAWMRGLHVSEVVTKASQLVGAPEMP